MSNARMVAEVLSNKTLLRLVISRVFPISDFLGTPSGSHYLCPFHMDSTPSAKIHRDDDLERLYCFSCRRQFTSYDYLTRIRELNPSVVLKNYITPEQLEAAVAYFKFNEDGDADRYEPGEAFKKASAEGLQRLLKFVYLEDAVHGE